jgi:threonine dehydrogenase-like Zn-dependent dehydrogenase
MEAHGNPISKRLIHATSSLPKVVGRRAIQKAGIDQLDALYATLRLVRCGDTVSVSGVSEGLADPIPMMEILDKGITVRMGKPTPAPDGGDYGGAAP